MSMDGSHLTNQLLIAMPALEDANFARTVAYVCQHDDDGAMALIINRPATFTLGDILGDPELEPVRGRLAKIPVLLGGPVGIERGFVLHTTDERTWESSLQPAPGLAVTTSRDILLAIANGQGPQRFLFALGYAGWAAGQLERELAENAWLTAPADPDLLFAVPPERRWHAATASIGIDPSRLSSYAGRA